MLVSKEVRVVDKVTVAEKKVVVVSNVTSSTNPVTKVPATAEGRNVSVNRKGYWHSLELNWDCIAQSAPKYDSTETVEASTIYKSEQPTPLGPGT